MTESEKEYIIFQPPDNEEVQAAIKSWLRTAHGRMSLQEIERRLEKEFL